jgi:hypothetical protein
MAIFFELYESMIPTLGERSRPCFWRKSPLISRFNNSKTPPSRQVLK